MALSFTPCVAPDTLKKLYIFAGHENRSKQFSLLLYVVIDTSLPYVVPAV